MKKFLTLTFLFAVSLFSTSALACKFDEVEYIEFGEDVFAKLTSSDECVCEMVVVVENMCSEEVLNGEEMELNDKFSYESSGVCETNN